MDIEKTLIELGLQDHEVKVYLATLSLGESTVLPISKKSGLGRTYCYDILETLSQKGFVSFVEIRGRRHYSASEPRAIKKLLEDKIKLFDNILPGLEGLYQQSPSRPKVRFFQGKDGIEVIFNEILREAKEVSFWSSISDWAKSYPDYVGWIKKQVRKDIKIRDLVRKSPEALAYQNLYQKGRQEMRFLPETAQFKTDNMVFNNKFVMISYGADLYAVSVESAEIAQTMRVIFEMLWTGAEKN